LDKWESREMVPRDKRFRGEFETFEEFIQWYNRRPHRAMKLEELESPEDAFWNRLPMEAKFRI
jgi:transposase InsO family protein